MKKIIGVALLSTFLITGCGNSEAKSDKKEEKNFFITGDLNDSITKSIYVDKIGNVSYEFSNGSAQVVPFKDLTPEQVKILQKEGVKFPEELLKEKQNMQSK